MMPGKKANKRISDKLTEKGIQTEILVPVHKDWNDDRASRRGGNCPALSCGFFFLNEDEKEGEEECQALVL